MSLASYARSAISRAGDGGTGGYGDDRFKASDQLVRPFGALDKQVVELKQLQAATMTHVYAKLNDKGRIEIVPVDANAFDSLSGKIEVLAAKVGHNQDVLDRLETACKDLGIEDYSLARMTSSRNAVATQIRDIKEHALDGVQHLFQAAEALGNRGLAEKNPAVVKAKKEAATTVKDLEIELGTWTDKIDRLESVLREFKQ